MVTSKAPHVPAEEARGSLGSPPAASAQGPSASASNPPLSSLKPGPKHTCDGLDDCICTDVYRGLCLGVRPRCIQDASLSLPIKNEPQRAERQEGRQLSAEFAQFQFVISIYDQVTTSPEKEAFHGNTDTYCCVNYRPLLALPIYALCSFLTLSSDSFLPFLKTVPKEQLFSICSWALQQTTVSLLATLSSLL